MAKLEAWAQVAWKDPSWAANWADHTYVKCIDNGRFFDCWADHGGQDQRWITTGYADYRIPDCYRVPLWVFPDTAGIGAYAVDGVCHQSTNCFLFPTGRTLDFNVRGYWFSLFSYGTYGRSFWRWLGWPYGTCSVMRTATMARMEEAGDRIEDTPADTPVPPDALPEKIHGLHAEAANRPSPPDPHETLMDEVALVTKHHAPEIEPGKFRGLQTAYLKQMDALTKRGLTGERLAAAVNELSVETQKKLAKTLSDEEYMKLMGVETGNHLNLAEPAAAAASGKKPPDGRKPAE